MTVTTEGGSLDLEKLQSSLMFIEEVTDIRECMVNGAGVGKCGCKNTYSWLRQHTYTVKTRKPEQKVKTEADFKAI